MLPQHRYSSCVCVMDGLLILFPGRGVVWLLSGDTEYSREETHSDETCAHTHTTEAPQLTVDNRVVCASLSAAEKKRREEHVMFPLFTTNCPVSGGYRHKPGYSQQLQPIFPPVWWPDEFGCDLYCLPREHKEQIALSLATVYLVLSYLYQFPWRDINTVPPQHSDVNNT